MPKTPEGPATDGTSVSPVVSPKTNADPEDFPFHHPELLQEVDAYSDLDAAAVEALAAGAAAALAAVGSSGDEEDEEVIPIL